MGGKPTWSGKFLYLCLAGLTALFLSGCPASQRTTTSREEIPAVPKPAPQDFRLEACGSLGQARALRLRGDFEGSTRQSLKALSLAGKNSPGDEALFHLGLIHVHPANPRRDLGKALSYFQRILNEHPRSPWVEEARAWAAVLQENEKLQLVIQQSKKVDLEVEEKKREKAR